MPNSICESKTRKNLIKESASDKEYVSWLIFHLTLPCSLELDGTIHNLGNFYLRMAQDSLQTITDENQKKRLEDFIGFYVASYGLQN